MTVRQLQEQNCVSCACAKHQMEFGMSCACLFLRSQLRVSSGLDFPVRVRVWSSSEMGYQVGRCCRHLLCPREMGKARWRGWGKNGAQHFVIKRAYVSEFDTSPIKEKCFPLFITAVFSECPSYFVWKVDEIRERKAPWPFKENNNFIFQYWKVSDLKKIN